MVFPFAPLRLCSQFRSKQQRLVPVFPVMIERLNMSSKLDALERLAGLRDRGVLTDEEFVREKLDLFGAVPATPAPDASTRSLAPKQIAPKPDQTAGDRSQPTRATQNGRAEKTAKEKRFWSFEPINRPEDAAMLLAAGWLSAGLIVLNGALDVAADLWIAMQGGQLDFEISNGEALLYHLAGLVIWSALVVATTWGASARRNRFAAVFLVVLVAFDLLASLVARWDGNTTLRNAAVLIGAPAIVMAIQCVRANLAIRRFSGASRGNPVAG